MRRSMRRGGKPSEDGAGNADDELAANKNSEVGGSVLAAWVVLLWEPVG